MFKRVLLLSQICLFVGSTALGSSIDLGMNDDSAEVDFRHTLSADALGASELNVKGVYNSEEVEDVKIVGVGLDVFGEWVNGLKLGIGAKAYGIDVDPNEALSIAFGGLVKFAPSYMRGFGIYGGAYYAPQVFSWADAEHMVDIDAGVSYQIIPRAGVFLGYNKTKVDFDIGGSTTIDEGVRGGLTLHF